MTKREKIENSLPSGVSLSKYYLDDSLDKALLGYVERGGGSNYLLPCYGYQAIKAVLKEQNYSGAEMYEKMKELIPYSDNVALPLILTKYKKEDLWAKIRSLKLNRWEGLNSAIIGLGTIGYRNTGVVYNKVLCVEVLEDTSSGLSSNESDDVISSIRKLEENLVPVDVGKYTPWYLTPIK